MRQEDATGPGAGVGPVFARLYRRVAARSGKRRTPDSIDAKGRAELEQAFVAAMASVCAPVTVATSMSGRHPHGTTVSAFSSLSLQPPMVMLSLDRRSDLLGIIRSTGRFGINVLGHGQDVLAARFARKGADKFEGVDWREDHGLPRLEATAGWLVCDLDRLVWGGDHAIAIGVVVTAEPLPGAPLVYHRSHYGTHSGFVPSMQPEAPSQLSFVESTAVWQFATIPEALEDIRQGKFVVIADARTRATEGDLIIAAEFVTPEAVNFMVSHGRGLTCVALTEERCAQLGLRPMGLKDQSPSGSLFTVSIEAREGVTTGISAADRARTIQVASDPAKGAADLVQPGHVFPLLARPGGVLQHVGPEEAAVDLARLAGLRSAGAVCAVLNEDGTMATIVDLISFTQRHGLKLITIEELVEYRYRTELLVDHEVSVRLPTAYGEFTAAAFREKLTNRLHVAFIKGEVRGAEDVLVHIHLECLAGDVFHSLGCDCRGQLEAVLRRLAGEPHGVLLYMAREATWAALGGQLSDPGAETDRSSAAAADEPSLHPSVQETAIGPQGVWPAFGGQLPDRGAETDRRAAAASDQPSLHPSVPERAIGAQILIQLGLSSIRALSTSPAAIEGIEEFGIAVTERLAPVGPMGGSPHLFVAGQSASMSRKP